MEWGVSDRSLNVNKFTYPLQVTKVCECKFFSRFYVLNSEQADEGLDQIGFMDKDRNGEAICIA